MKKTYISRQVNKYKRLFLSMFLKQKNTFLLWAILIFTVAFFSCKKADKFYTGTEANLTTSVDSLKYDTVFTTVGSVTKSFKVFNNNNQKLNLSSVKLMGGAASFYKMNVDGISGTQLNNVEIPANDSIYIFVSVTINPNSATMPYVVQDSIQIQYNGNTKQIQLQAYGQNAIFLNNYKLTGNQVWNKTLPYVIIGTFKVDTAASLTITEGTKIYLHADAPFIVDGNLVVNGKKWDSTRVIFQGDRLDEPYKNYPASWPGILFRGQSKNNIFNYAVIKNAYQGVIVDGPSINANPKLTLNECKIDNAYDAGILAINSSVTAKNCLISNCGNNIGIALGGMYSFTHCTLASYSNSNILHKDPVLIATNYLKQSNNTFLTANLNASFTNCIFWGEFGTVDDEVVADKLGTNTFTVTFTKCLYKVKTSLSPLITSTGGTVNATPVFDSINTSRSFYDFRVKANSPALNVGTTSLVNIDLDGNPRPVGIPDIGCYEKQ
jgi:hypothetical protein